MESGAIPPRVSPTRGRTSRSQSLTLTVVVVGDGAAPSSPLEGSVRRPGEVDEEGLVPLLHRVADDRDGNGLAGFPWRKGQRSRRRYVVVAGDGPRTIGGGVVHRHGPAAGRSELHREDGKGRPGVALDDRDVVDRELGQRVIVQNGALPLTLADGRVARIAQVDEEGLVRFVQRVALGDDRDRLRRLAGGKGERPLGAQVISVGSGGAVGGGIGHGHGLSTGWGEAHREYGVPGAAGALADGE